MPNRKSVYQPRPGIDRNVKIQNEFKLANEFLEKAKDKFGHYKIGKARTCVIKADLYVNKASKIDVIDKDMVENELEDINIDLEETILTFYNNDYDFLYSKCLLLQAKILFKLDEFSQCRQKTILCLNCSKQINLTNIVVEAQNLF